MNCDNCNRAYKTKKWLDKHSKKCIAEKILIKEEPLVVENESIENTDEKQNLGEENKIYLGDCYSNLKLVSDKTISTIYWDPPFNSDRNYNLSHDSQIGFGDKWDTDKDYETFIENILLVLRSKLKDNGSLFFHISSQEQFIPFCILKKYFNFVNPIYWKKCRSKNNVKNKLGAAIDVIFWCFDSKKRKFNMVTQPKDEYYLKNSFKNKDKRGNYGLGHLVTEKTKRGYLYEITLNDTIFNPKSGWRIKKEKLEELIKDDRVHIPTKKGGNLYKKIYLHENPGKPCMDLWDDIHSIAQGSSDVRRYPTAKPVKLLERIISMTSDEGDIILDPMAGSGTTGEAAKNLNRKYILMDQNQDAIDIIKERLE